MSIGPQAIASCCAFINSISTSVFGLPFGLSTGQIGNEDYCLINWKGILVMKRLDLLTCLLIAVMTPHLGTAGLIEWESLEGPYGGSFGGAAAWRGTTIAVTADPGSCVYVSPDGGGTWKRSNPVLSARSLAISPDGAIIVLGRTARQDSVAIFHSLDDGRTWQQHALPPIHHSEYDFTTDFDGGLYLAFGSEDAPQRGLLYSNDLGAAWTDISADLPAKGWCSRVVMGLDSTVYVLHNAEGGFFGFIQQTVYAGRAPFRSWRPLFAVAENHSEVQTIIGQSDGRVLFSLANGRYAHHEPESSGWRFFSEFNMPPLRSQPLADPLAGLHYGLGTGDALFELRDAESEWKRVEIPPAKPISVAVDNRGAVLLLERQRVFRRELNDAAFAEQRLNRGLYQTSVETFAVAPDGTILAALNNNLVRMDPASGVWDSGDRTLPSNASINILYAASDSRLYAGSGSILYSSGDQGETWQELRDFQEPLAFIRETPSGALLVAGRRKLYQQRDTQSWDILLQYANVNTFRQRANDEMTLTSPSGIFHTLDGGDSWRRLPLQANAVYDLLRPQPNVFIASEQDDRIIRSIDNGNTWARVWPVEEGPGTFSDRFELLQFNNGDIYALNYQTALLSSDAGLTWTEAVAPDHRFFGNANWTLANDRIYFAPIAGGIMRSVRRVTSLAERPRPHIEPPALQIQPNPGSGARHFNITLQGAAEVSLSIVSSHGRLVRRLEFGLLPAGTHSVTRSDAGLQAGVYLCRLEAGDTTYCVSMLVLR